MTYDPNSDQEQQFLPEMQQDDSLCSLALLGEALS